MDMKTKKFKRLFFDIETSPNLVHSWNVGYKLQIGPENIVKERAIICICYKWAHEKKVHELHWDRGDDKAMLQKFITILNSADEVIGHNSDQFDIKWVRTRCLFHGIPTFPDYVSIDTLKLSKKGFKFNSNKLDYIAQFLGLGAKLKTGYDLWKKIVLSNDSTAMSKMIKYCKKDVLLLEKIFNKLKNYSKSKTHIGMFNNEKALSTDCSECGSSNTVNNKQRITAKGIKQVQMRCNDCGKMHSVSYTVYKKSKENKK